MSPRVPQDLDIVVEGFRIFGGVRVEPAQRTGEARRTVKVREYSLVGGSTSSGADGTGRARSAVRAA